MSENLLPPTPAINDWLVQATKQLESAGISTARLDAELILTHTLRKGRTYLHAHADDLLDERQHEVANARLSLRKERVPVAYIIGHKEFYGHRFHVTSATLIPRPESEALINLLAMTERQQSLLSETRRLVDVGTGSGILGITAKLNFPSLSVTLIDDSRHALQVAEKNATALHADVAFLQSDLLEAYPFSADVIVANLPYVDMEWERSPETEHEPAHALFAQLHGLALIFRLIEQTREKLANGGSLILEADPEQHDEIIKYAAKYGLLHQETNDYGLLLNKVSA
jgi:release factor glutamine methyltransferase